MTVTGLNESNATQPPVVYGQATMKAVDGVQALEKLGIVKLRKLAVGKGIRKYGRMKKKDLALNLYARGVSASDDPQADMRQRAAEASE